MQKYCSCISTGVLDPKFKNTNAGTKSFFEGSGSLSVPGRDRGRGFGPLRPLHANACNEWWMLFLEKAWCMHMSETIGLIFRQCRASADSNINCGHSVSSLGTAVECSPILHRHACMTILPKILGSFQSGRESIHILFPNSQSQTTSILKISQLKSTQIVFCEGRPALPSLIILCTFQSLTTHVIAMGIAP